MRTSSTTFAKCYLPAAVAEIVAGIGFATGISFPSPTALTVSAFGIVVVDPQMIEILQSYF